MDEVNYIYKNLKKKNSQNAKYTPKVWESFGFAPLKFQIFDTLSCFRGSFWLAAPPFIFLLMCLLSIRYDP